MCGITTHVSQTRCFECINFIATHIHVLQTTHMCVASETDRDEPTLECINFIATQINVKQTTQIMSQAKIVGAACNLMHLVCVARGFVHILNVVSQTPYSYIVQFLSTGSKKTLSK